MADYYSLSVLAFIFILLMLLYKDRKNWSFSIISIRRFKVRGKFFDRAALRARKFWEIFSIAGIFVCAALFFEGLQTFAATTQLIIEKKFTWPTGGLVIPYPAPRFEIGYGYVLLPFWFFIVALPLIIIPHEALHGIIFRLKGIRIKSVGMFLLLFLFGGAFVEQDKRSFERARLLSKIKAACAGSFANFLISLLFFAAISAIWQRPPIFVNGIKILNVSEGSPAFSAGLRGGEVIFSIDGQSFVGRLEKVNLTLNLTPGQMVFAQSLNRTYQFQAGAHPLHPERGYLGVSFAPLTTVNQLWLNLLWLAALEYWVAMLNILPIYPLDGGVIFQSLVKGRFKGWRFAVAAVSTFFIGWLSFLIFGPLIFKP